MKFSDEFLQEVFEWDSLTWRQSIGPWESVLNTIGPDSKVLEVGSRSGGLSLLCASLGAQHVTCTDLREPDLTLWQSGSRRTHRDQVTFTQLNLLNPTDQFANSSFDVVCFKSVLGGMSSREGQEQMMETITSLLKPGGTIFFAENLYVSRLHAFLRRSTNNWASQWAYPTTEELTTLFADYDLELSPIGLLPPIPKVGERFSGIRQRLSSLIEPLLPASWRYVAAGTARLSA